MKAPARYGNGGSSRRWQRLGAGTVYGVAVIELAIRATICAMVGHDWELHRKKCARCEIGEETLYRLGYPR